MTIRGDEPLSADSGPNPESARGRADEAGATDAVAGASASSGGGTGALSGGASDRPGGGGLFAGGFPAAGLPTDDAYGQSATDPVGNGRADDLPADDPATGIPDRVLPADDSLADAQSADDPVGDAPVDSPVEDLPDGTPPADAPPDGGSPVDGSADDPADDEPADGGGVSPVVREYVERLRSEALARDAQLRARGIDPYKGTPVDEGPRRRLGARALAVLVVLVVAAVSVGAYALFLRGEPDYGMSHGYHVQSDGSLKRPPVTDKAPEQPPEMNKADEAGAAAAARYYLNAYSYAWNTGDTTPIKAISDEECAFCQREIEQIDEFYSNGYWATGTYASIISTDSIDRVSDDVTDSTIFDVQFHIDEHTPEGYSSKGYESGSRYDTIIKFRVQRKENEWRVIDGRAADADTVS